MARPKPEWVQLLTVGYWSRQVLSKAESKE